MGKKNKIKVKNDSENKNKKEMKKISSKNFFNDEQNSFEKDEENSFIREMYVKDITEEDEKNEIIRNIINTRKELFNVNRNFDFVNNEELIDYYIYKIKSIQSKLNNLIKLAKEKGIEINRIA